MAIETFALRLLGGFAGVATLLACVGLYGVLSLSVSARTKEIAVRKAIGAQARQVLGLVLAEGARLVVVGIVLGSLGALLLGRAVERLLFGVSAWDPVSLAAAAGLLASVALVACAIPAWRASRVALMDALRQD
jgi:ABC-type antimicrobial peptide transport system permease subunit